MVKKGITEMKILCKTPLGETGCLSIFLGYLSMSPALHPGFSDPWRSPPALSSTWLLSVAYFLFRHPVFFIHLLFPSTCVTYGTSCHAIGNQVLLTQPSSTCVNYGMPCRTSGHQAPPIQSLPRELGDFPRGGNHSKYVPLHTYLAWLQPICYDLGFVFIHAKLKIFLLVVKTLIKKHRATATLISSYESRN